MKLLFDENLSARLVALLQADHPGSAHVEQLLSVGNAGTDAIAALVRARAEDLKRFEANAEEALLVIEST